MKFIYQGLVLLSAFAFIQARSVDKHCVDYNKCNVLYKEDTENTWDTTEDFPTSEFPFKEDNTWDFEQGQDFESSQQGFRVAPENQAFGSVQQGQGFGANRQRQGFGYSQQGIEVNQQY